MKKKAALLQMRPEWARPEANRKQVEQLVSRAMEEAEDILVLPELWDTGFFPSENLDSLADVDGCKARNFLSEMARCYRVNIVGGSVLVKEGSCYYNRAYVVNRSGQVTAEYDKVHGFPRQGNRSCLPEEIVRYIFFWTIFHALWPSVTISAFRNSSAEKRWKG